MGKDTETRTGRHAVFYLHVHLVFVAKYRRKLFGKEIHEDMREIFKNICHDFEARLVEFDGGHVHLLVHYPPKVSVSWLVSSLKEVSSRLLKKKDNPGIRALDRQDAIWSPSYFAGSCGAAPISVIRQYIEQLKTPD